MTKDWGYLGGLVLVRSFAESNEAGVNVLRRIKWSANHLALAMELHTDDLLRTPELLVEKHAGPHLTHRHQGPRTQGTTMR